MSKICSKCGKDLSTNEVFCNVCGNKVARSSLLSSTSVLFDSSAKIAKKKSKMLTIIALSCVLVLTLFVCSACSLSKDADNNKVNTEKNADDKKADNRQVVTKFELSSDAIGKHIYSFSYSDKGNLQSISFESEDGSSELSNFSEYDEDGLPHRIVVPDIYTINGRPSINHYELADSTEKDSKGRIQKVLYNGFAGYVIKSGWNISYSFSYYENNCIKSIIIDDSMSNSMGSKDITKTTTFVMNFNEDGYLTDSQKLLKGDGENSNDKHTYDYKMEDSKVESIVATPVGSEAYKKDISFSYDKDLDLYPVSASYNYPSLYQASISYTKASDDVVFTKALNDCLSKNITTLVSSEPEFLPMIF
ncbi:MAG: hypothetical protein MJ189_01025 [Coriobacteriales bacterium]|nr:hypothetical protein [Coriobacteriales bacterium]